MDVAIHINPTLSHQRQHAVWLTQGFLKHGVACSVLTTPEGMDDADVHVVSGPHFAKWCWLDHPRTILLDRCYYRGDPEHVSLGWLNSKGGRRFHKGEGREPPTRGSWPLSKRRIYLADYDAEHPYDDARDCACEFVRHHPARYPGTDGVPLEEALRGYGTAVGRRTTALVTAALFGLDYIVLDGQNILAEHDWLELLPYADWHGDEIASGLAWEHLRCALES